MTLYKQDHLRNLAEKYINNVNYSFETIKEKNITAEFNAQYKLYFKKGTKVVLNFNGHTTDGKSTACAYLVQKGNKYMNRPMKAKYMLGNQQEYAYWVQENPDTMHVMLQIDEWSKLAEGGANATVEQSYFEELSNIHAQMFVHTAYCSPKQLPDENIILHLEVASADNGITVCYVYYNLTRAGNNIPQIIGHIVMDVRSVMKSAWYKKYRDNKFKRIELVRKEKNVNERDLYYAKPIRDIIRSLTGRALMGKAIPPRNIIAKSKVYCAREGIRMTMLGMDYVMVTEVKPVLDMYVDNVKLNDEINKYKKMIQSNKFPGKVDDMKHTIETLKEQIKINQDDINFTMNDLDKRIKLFEKYKSIK